MFGTILITLGIIIWAVSKSKGAKKWQEYADPASSTPAMNVEPESPWDFDTTKPFTYDDSIEPEAKSYEEYPSPYEIHTPEPMSVPNLSRSSLELQPSRDMRSSRKPHPPQTLQEPHSQLNTEQHTSENNSEPAAGLLEGGFDLRDAIIYSEILKPKFEEM